MSQLPVISAGIASGSAAFATAETYSPSSYSGVATPSGEAQNSVFSPRMRRIGASDAACAGNAAPSGRISSAIVSRTPIAFFI